MALALQTGLWKIKLPLSGLTELKRGFTLIELLIVVAIIAILAAIAVPNFLTAQTRAKAARVQSDLRAVATGVEFYRIDHSNYPDGTDNPAGYDPAIVDLLTPYGLERKYYGFRVRNTDNGDIVGRNFAGITTPIAYMTNVPNDPFVKQCGNWTYCYRPTKKTRNGYVLTSVGPDCDHLGLNGDGRGNTNTANPFSTALDQKLGDVSESAVISFLEGTNQNFTEYGKTREYLSQLTYDATNGTVSDGDIIRIGPGQ